MSDFDIELARDCENMSHEIKKLQEENKNLREALGELIHHCRDYGITSESFAICMAVNQAVQAIEKVSKRST